MSKAKELFYSIESKARKFLYTDAYILLVLAIVFIAWTCQNETFGFIALITVSCFALVFSNDIIPLTVNIFSAALMIYTGSVATFAHMWPTFIPLGIAIAIFVVRNFNKHFTFGKMFIPQICVSVALLLGGAGIVEKSNYLDALPICLALGVGVLAVYILYGNFTNKNSGVEISTYFAKVLALIGVVVGLELIVVILRSGLAPSDWGGSGWNTGWGNRNNVATYLVICAPMAMYLSTKKRFSVVYILIALFEYVCLLMTLSRGGILFGAIAAVVGAVFSIVKAENRKKQLIGWGIAIVIVGVLLAIFNDMTVGLIKSIMNRVNTEGDVTSGRSALYKEAWELFKQYPIVGGGMGHVGTNAGMKNDMGLYWFHSTLFQIIGCMGIVGILAYGYYYATKIYLFVKKRRSAFALFILVVWIGFEGYSMIDTGTMTPFPNMMLIMVTTYLLESIPVDENGRAYEDLTRDVYRNAIYKRVPKQD